jgi:hypothetical protein
LISAELGLLAWFLRFLQPRGGEEAKEYLLRQIFVHGKKAADDGSAEKDVFYLEWRTSLFVIHSP